MAHSQALIAVDGRRRRIGSPLFANANTPGQPAARVVESRAGRIVVRHEDGYVFVFQIHDLEDLVMNLEQVTWSSIGAPPDAEALEQQARAVAEAEAQARGWLA